MTFQQPNETLRQSMHRLLDRFDYLEPEEDAEYEVNLEEDTGYVRLFGIKEDDLSECRTVMSDGFETITLEVAEQEDGTYVVTANYDELP